MWWHLGFFYKVKKENHFNEHEDGGLPFSGALDLNSYLHKVYTASC